MSNTGSGTDNELLGTKMEDKRPSNSRGNTAVPRLLLGAVFGWAIWAASPSLTGQVEPWDSISVYYSASLFVAGLASTLFRPAGWYWGPVGVYGGQVAYMLFVYMPRLPRGDPLIFPAPIAVALFGTMQALAGGLLGAGIGFVIAWAFGGERAQQGVAPASGGFGRLPLS